MGGTYEVKKMVEFFLRQQALPLCRRLEFMYERFVWSLSSFTSTNHVHHANLSLQSVKGITETAYARLGASKIDVCFCLEV